MPKLRRKVKRRHSCSSSSSAGEESQDEDLLDEPWYKFGKVYLFLSYSNKWNFNICFISCVSVETVKYFKHRKIYIWQGFTQHCCFSYYELIFIFYGSLGMINLALPETGSLGSGKFIVQGHSPNSKEGSPIVKQDNFTRIF